MLIYYTDINECLIDNGGCEHNCTNLEGINNRTGLGYQCECDNDHNCSQVCVELEGSFNCSCYSGYELQQDRATCEGN